MKPMPPMTPVRLLKPHTHAGCLHLPGERLEVSAATSEWLIAQEVARVDSQMQVRPLRTDVPLLSQKPQPMKDPTP